MNNILHTLGRATAAVLLAVVFIGGCATSGVNRGDINLVSLDEEWQLGAQIEQDLQGKLQLVDDGTAQAYLSRMGQRIVAQTEMRKLPWEFHLVADPEVNAFNTPGGHVYVNTGLIAAAGNASQLAGVLAHEIAHGVSRHGTERLTKAYGANIGASLLLGKDPAVYQQVLAQLVAGGTFAKFSRDAEREADRLGLRYMYEAGYNPNGMAGMFETLLQERGRRPSGVEQFFSSHPLTEERIAEARREARALPSSARLITNDAGFRTVQQRVRRYN